ncbi:MAG: cupin domain-containing protein [Zymomonas sp.]|nr:MAG: cupin domain-containing protein [Zymomonas sp.]
MKLMMFDETSVAAVSDAPPVERVLSGEPRTRTWNLEDDGTGLYAGIWEATPGEWAVEYTEWEFCHIISGRSVLTPEEGPGQTVRAGDSFIIPRGFKGTWTVIETTVKHYVIKE